MIGNSYKLILMTVALAICQGVFCDGTSAAGDPRQFCTRSGTVQVGNKIRISGTLFEEIFNGPPNFGETPKTDKKGTSIILRLDDPLRVDRKDSGTINTSVIVVRQIQVAASNKALADYTRLRGRHVVISGELFPEETAYHVRPILISADALRAGGRIACDGTEVKLP